MEFDSRLFAAERFKPDLGQYPLNDSAQHKFSLG